MLFDFQTLARMQYSAELDFEPTCSYSDIITGRSFRIRIYILEEKDEQAWYIKFLWME